MSLTFTSRLWALALALFALGFVAPADAVAKKTAPQISSFEMEPVDRLAAGGELFFRLQGTPDGKATVRVPGVQRTIILQEVDDGTYEGGYTLRSVDRPQPRSSVTALLRKNGLSATSRIQFAAPPPIAAAPTPAPAPQQPQAVAIQRFTAAQVDRLEPGTELKFALDGTAGQRVSFTIEGVASGIPMREVRAGHYEGAYVLKRGDRLQPGVPIVATIEGGGGQVAKSELPRRSLLVDARPPTIRNVTPRDGDVISDAGAVTVSGTFDDRGGLGVDPATVKIIVGGRDVTPQATVTKDFFTFRADLPPGNYAADVTARDFAGNPVRQAWSFQVHAGAVGSGTVSNGYFPLEFTSHQANATVPAGGPVQVRGRTAPNAAVDVEVLGLAPVVGMIGVTHKLLNRRITADRNGDFVFDFTPQINVPGMRYEVSVKANQGGQVKESNLVLFAQR
jgi:hypothetical protein